MRRQLTDTPPTPVTMGIATPVTVTDAQATTTLPMPVEAIRKSLMPVPVTDILSTAESQLEASCINILQVHQDSTNMSVCSSDSDAHENLKSHFNYRLSDKVNTTFKELFGNVNNNSVREILPKINEYNNEIAKFV